MADAEARLAEDGFESAWAVVYQAEAPTGAIPLEVWRYEKDLRAVARLKEADAEA